MKKSLVQKARNSEITLDGVEEKIITLRGQLVLLDSDVATLYEVQTKEINQAVKNNPKKFPQGYVFELDEQEATHLRSKFLTANLGLIKTFDQSNSEESLRSKFLTLDKNGRGQHAKYPPKAFTEKGLYMLATILKGIIHWTSQVPHGNAPEAHHVSNRRWSASGASAEPADRVAHTSALQGLNKVGCSAPAGAGTIGGAVRRFRSRLGCAPRTSLHRRLLTSRTSGAVAT